MAAEPLNEFDWDDVSRTGEADPAAVIAAMRLATLGAPDDATALAMLRDLLDCASETPPEDTDGPSLLVARIRAGKFRVFVDPVSSSSETTKEEQ